MDLQHSYFFTRIVIIRFLAFLYFVAFLIALNQNKGLIGENGLLPAHHHLKFLLNRMRSDRKSYLNLFSNVPTFLWFCDINSGLDVESKLELMSITGVSISVFVMFTGRANMLVLTLLWLLYHSIVNVGQSWYSFGWESQLLETGFISIFFVPLLSLSFFTEDCPPSRVVIWGYRWLIFRIMIGAGLIKIRGDECWRNLTCMNFHYETQPVPNPIAFYLHKSPELVHKMETLGNHFVELIAPWFILLPYRRCRLFAAFVQIAFQAILIISGNLSFLNWLTILPSIALLDDLVFSYFFSDDVVEKVRCLGRSETYSGKIRKFYKFIHLILLCLIAYLSLPIVSNLLSSRQLMNSSFDNFRLVNTYGAFGSVTKERTEVIVEGTKSLNPYDDSASWLEYEFKCKPGDVNRRPCLISPYHYRLDWLMWFAAFQRYHHNPWLVHLAAKFLMNDEKTLKLIANNPFPESPPRFIRMQHYLYQYADVTNNNGSWWKREMIGEYMPPVSLKELESVMKRQNWPINAKTPAEKKLYDKKRTRQEL